MVDDVIVQEKLNMTLFISLDPCRYEYVIPAERLGLKEMIEMCKVITYAHFLFRGSENVI